MRLTNAELRVISFLLRIEKDYLSKWVNEDQGYTRVDFEAALDELSDKLRRKQYKRSPEDSPMNVDAAINSLIEAHKKKQLVLSTPSSVGPEIT